MDFNLLLYLVTDGEGLSEPTFLYMIAKACEGGVTLVQLREKELSGRDYYERAVKVKAVTDAFGIPLIIDDRVDVAMASGAAGVHLGQADLPIATARAIMGQDKIIGATAKTVGQALIAEAEGADYLGVGAIYPTTTKVVTVITPVATLSDIAGSVKIPIVAIGGLNSGNIDVLHKSGANGVAVVTAIMKSTNPEKSAAELRRKAEVVLEINSL